METKVTSAALEWVFNSISNDRIDDVLELGLKEEDAMNLQYMTLRQYRRLCNGADRFITVTIDREKMNAAMNDTERCQFDDLEDEFLLLGAPLPLMKLLFGMRPTEFCRRRKYLMLNGTNIGRPKSCDEATEHLIFTTWRDLDGLELRERFMKLAQRTGLSLTTTFPVVRHCEGWDTEQGASKSGKPSEQVHASV